MSDLFFRHHVHDAHVDLLLEKGVREGILRRQKLQTVGADQWLDEVHEDKLHVVSRLEGWAERETPGVEVLADGRGYRLAHERVAELTDAQAAAVDFPGPVDLVLKASSTGALLADPNSTITIAWTDKGRVVRPRRVGAFLYLGTTVYRLPKGLFDLLESVEQLKPGQSVDDRFEKLTAFKRAMDSGLGIPVDLDRQLDGIQIAHATAMSVTLTSNSSVHEFDPVLMTRDEGGNSPDLLLTPRQQDAFADAFKSKSESKRSYLAGDVFVFVDPSLRIGMDVVKRVQSSGVETRKRFLRSPHSFVKQAMIDSGQDEEFVDELVESAFVITEELSERVREIGIWAPPVLPFIERVAGGWKDIRYGLKIGTNTVTIPEKQLDEVKNKVIKALDRGDYSVDLGDLGVVEVSQEAVDAIEAIQTKAKEFSEKAAQKVEPDDTDDENTEDEPKFQDKQVAIVANNFESEGFTIGANPRGTKQGYQRPRGLLNAPKSHQTVGIGWIQDCWLQGYAGALLADDMGLGKTFQTLGFLSWLFDKRDSLGKKKLPTLIVAPTTLLGTWQREAETHLDAGQLGTMTLLYGNSLRQIRTDGDKNDLVSGRPTLNLDILRKSDWILTTYETVRDYQHSLARVPMACGVFDEMQRIKNPTSMVTNAAQSLNIDFKLGLTGTPVENSLQDLWTLFDTLMPGALGLGSLKEFSARFISASVDSERNADYADLEPEERKRNRLRRLHSLLFEPSEVGPAPMLRRIKSDVAKDLPAKRIVLRDREMPTVQEEAYDEAMQMFRSAGHGQALIAFQRLRATALHPRNVASAHGMDANEFISMSARLTELFVLLDEIHQKAEKVLVFVEKIELHDWLAAVIKRRFGLHHKPDRIFGSISAQQRQKIVDRFQSHDNVGFDVLLLSPKAAGVGITLTAATNVVHLERWWNPAVEDQCTDRAYRIGQTQDVTVYLPRATHSIHGTGCFDGFLHELLEVKRALSADVLSPQNESENVAEMMEMMRSA